MSESRNPKLVPVYVSKFCLAYSAYKNIGKDSIRHRQGQENVSGGRIGFDGDIIRSTSLE